jgi:hypothetical protein
MIEDRRIESLCESAVPRCPNARRALSIINPQSSIINRSSMTRSQILNARS